MQLAPINAGLADKLAVDSAGTATLSLLLAAPVRVTLERAVTGQQVTALQWQVWRGVFQEADIANVGGGGTAVGTGFYGPQTAGWSI